MDPGSEAASGHTVESLAQEIELLKREIHDRDEEIRDSVARVRFNGSIYDSRQEKSSPIVREDVSLIPEERVTISQMLPMEAGLKSVISLPRILPEAQARSGRPEARQTSQLIPGEAGFGIPHWVSSEATRRGSPSSHIYVYYMAHRQKSARQKSADIIAPTKERRQKSDDKRAPTKERQTLS